MVLTTQPGGGTLLEAGLADRFATDLTDTVGALFQSSEGMFDISQLGFQVIENRQVRRRFHGLDAIAVSLRDRSPGPPGRYG